MVYDCGLATAEEIAAKLGTEVVSVQSLNQRIVENSRNLILGVTVQNDGQLMPLWQYGCQVLQDADLSGKTVALYVSGRQKEAEAVIKDFCEQLKQHGARVVGQVLYTASHQWSNDYWIASISPNL